MKWFLVTLGLVSVFSLSHAQGTIAFGNSALTRVLIGCEVNVPDHPIPIPPDLSISVWYGPAGVSRDALQQAPGTASVGTTGVMINAPSVFAIPGSNPGDIVSLQIRGEGPGLYGETDVRQVTLGPIAGPGTVIWQTAAGAIPNRFTPLIVNCPEPSTLVLGALGGLALLFRVRKSSKTN